MATWTQNRTIEARPEEVIDVLTDPGAAGRWSPVPFEIEGLDAPRLEAGAHARVCGALAGMRVVFDVDVHEADAEQLWLSAQGPIEFDVFYELEPAGLDATDVHATVRVAPGGGLTGRMLARATDGLLRTGALRAALGRVADEAEALVPC